MKNSLMRSWCWKAISSLFFCSALQAQTGSQPLDNVTYDEAVQSVVVTSDINEYSYPVINLNSSEHLDISFDILRPVNENLMFTLVLCNAQWLPVNLMPNEYLSGNTFEQITGFVSSSNTYQKYIHYQTVFPTEAMNVKFGGNYLLKVFRNFNEQEILFTARCYVVNKKTDFSVRVHQPNAIDFRYTKQEVDADVNVAAADIPSPYTDAHLVILQNGRWDNALTTLKPKYINGPVYNYDFEEGNLFFGGNEFRTFDIRNIRSVGQNVSSKYIDTAIHVLLKPDEARGDKQHLMMTDLNGRYIIYSRTTTEQNQMDYAWVTFTLNKFSQDQNRAVYVLGAFNNWKPGEKYRMVYNESRKIYQCTVLLKQGYYNYMYAITDGNGESDVSETEGNHYETENDYYFFFYQKNYMYNYDELIGYQKINTGLNEKR